MKYASMQQEMKKQRMESVVYVAAELFLQQGIENVKMTDIGEKAEIGVASLYRYFGTKESIVLLVGELLWKDLIKLFDGVFSCDFYRNKTGYGQIEDLLKIYNVLYSSHKDFLRFVSEFDRFVIAHRVKKEELSSYESSVLDFYPLFCSAYEKGVADGSLRKGIDIGTLYLSVNHSLMSMTQKFLNGEILPGDDFHCHKEMDTLMEMALYFIKK